MLKLTRVVGKRIFINDGQIKIQVLDIQGNSVQLGFEAADDVIIDREEIAIRKRENPLP